MAAASSSSSPFFGIRDEDQNQIKQHQSSTPRSSMVQTSTPQKKKRNLPGTPNPDAEVIALSPKTLMATNRFICEVCNKGFQREQNLQLHRRGHNLPWKLRQKSTKEVRRKVYLCPETTCVHHDPSRALGDLTGIKKHFCRKHGEKKWKCDKCSKRYAVQSDWKAHSKTCGTREYRCDCGTLFSRRDSFITHRAFCDALAQESARIPSALNNMGTHLYGNSNMALSLSQINSPISSLQDQNHPSADILRLSGNGGPGGSQFDHLISSSNPSSSYRPLAPSSAFFLNGANQEFNEESQTHHSLLQNKSFHGLMNLPELQSNTNGSSSAAATNPFNLSFFSNGSTNNNINNNNNANNNSAHLSSSGLLIQDQFSSANGNGDAAAAAAIYSCNMMGDHMGSSVSSLFNSPAQNEAVIPQMSATALLQKAAQMGSTTNCNGGSFMRTFESSSSGGRKSDRPLISANFRGSFGSGGGESMRTSFENETHLQDLMNSLANGGGSAIFGGGAAFGGTCTNGGHEQETGFVGGFSRIPMDQHRHNTNLCNVDESKLHQNLTIGGGSDRFTRDFLGVGGMVRSISGGISQREQHLGIDIGPLDSELKPISGPNRSFGGANLQ